MEIPTLPVHVTSLTTDFSQLSPRQYYILQRSGQAGQQEDCPFTYAACNLDSLLGECAPDLHAHILIRLIT